jgi:hypothetical protein
MKRILIAIALAGCGHVPDTNEPTVEHAIDTTMRELAAAAHANDADKLHDVEDLYGRVVLGYLATRIAGRHSATIDRMTDSLVADFWCNVLMWLLGNWLGEPQHFVISLPENAAPWARLASRLMPDQHGDVIIGEQAAAISYLALDREMRARADDHLAELRAQRVGECVREEIIGRLLPSDPRFVELVYISRTATDWAKSVREITFVRYACPSSTALFAFTRYHHRAAILAWRFSTTDSWEVLQRELASVRSTAS